MDTPPDGPRIVELAELLEIPVSGLLRRGEAEFRDADDLPALDDDTALANWLSQHPRVIERPIVVNSADGARPRAVLGRPPENVLDLLPKG